MSKEKNDLEKQQLPEESGENTRELSPTWAQDALADLEDWIEEQGIYIRQ